MVLLSATPSPSPAPDLDSPWVVSPGIEGFIVFLVLAVAGWLLITSMLRHVRRANFRAAEREEELYGPLPTSPALPDDGADAPPSAGPPGGSSP